MRNNQVIETLELENKDVLIVKTGDDAKVMAIIKNDGGFDTEEFEMLLHNLKEVFEVFCNRQDIIYCHLCEGQCWKGGKRDFI